jgi:hypothetical protein
MVRRYQNKSESIVPPVAGSDSWIEPIKMQWFTDTEVPIREWALKSLYRHATMLPASVIEPPLPMEVFYNAFASISSYNWLTSTLLNTQQGYSVQPYFKCKIIDDLVTPNSIFTGVEPTAFGSFTNAPDGNVLAAGFDITNGVSFWKGSDLHSGVWDSSHQFETAAATVHFGQKTIAISCSDWINGSYHVDVYYLTNYGGDGTNIMCKHQHSDDGGATWSTGTITMDAMPNTLYFGASPKNLCIAAMKPRLISGVLNSGFAWLVYTGSVPGGYKVSYMRKVGASFTNQIPWSRNVESSDWVLHSLDSEYFNGKDYFVFSGYHTVQQISSANYGIWVTSLLTETADDTTDLWSEAVQVFGAASSSPTNLNSFTYPCFTADTTTLYIVFRSVVTDSYALTQTVGTANPVTTHNNYMLCKSVDGVHYSYPSIFVSSNGTEFNDSYFPVNQPTSINYAPQGDYWYIGGSAATWWEYTQNAVTADVSNDVLSYSVVESAGNPSSTQLVVGNQNNQWYGTSATKTGSGALLKNRKIMIQQGYINSNNVPETVPRSEFFIDDIEQKVTATTNDLIISGRDFHKWFKTTVTKYAFGWLGSYLYADIFDGTTMASWNTSGGVWQETGNTMAVAANSQSAVCLLTPSNYRVPYSSLMKVSMYRPDIGGHSYDQTHIYAFYIDQNNWLRLEYAGDSGWSIVQSVAGAKTTLASGSYSFSGTGYVPVIVKQYEYYKFQFLLATSVTLSGNQNNIDAWNSSQCLGGEIDVTNTMRTTASWQYPWNIGMGGTSTQAVSFSYFQYTQFDVPNTIGDMVKNLAGLAGVTKYNLQNTFEDYFHTTTSYTGAFTTSNRRIQITQGGSAINNNVSRNVSDGEVAFTAKLTSTQQSGDVNMSFAFRNGIADSYYFNISQISGIVQCRFQRLYGGVVYTFPNSMRDVVGSPANGAPLNIDLTQYHTYRVLMVDGWMNAYIDDVQVASWNDNNTDVAYLTTGSWGWICNTGTVVTIKEVHAPAFWKPVPSFSLNAGDDVDSAIGRVLQTQRAWMFSDILGRLKARYALSTDTSNYTYQNQIMAQGTDYSAKEYVSSVTVYGSNVMATVRNTTLNTDNLPMRDEVVVDYTILTQTDATKRATNEMNNANQFKSQAKPKQNMNVGSELLDVVTVINTGGNSSGFDEPTRVYGQAFTVDGQSREHSIEIDSGSV